MSHGPYRASRIGTIAITALFQQEDEELDLAKIRSAVETEIPNSGTDTTVTLGATEFQKGTTVVAQPASNNILVTGAGYYEILVEWHGDDAGTGPLIVKIAATGLAVTSYRETKIAASSAHSTTLLRIACEQLPAGATVGVTAAQTTGTANITFSGSLTVIKLATT